MIVMTPLLKINKINKICLWHWNEIGFRIYLTYVSIYKNHGWRDSIWLLTIFMWSWNLLRIKLEHMWF